MHVTLATLAWRSGVRWSSKVIITGYGEAVKACSLMDIRHLRSSTGVVNVLQCCQSYSQNYHQLNADENHRLNSIFVGTTSHGRYPRYLSSHLATYQARLLSLLSSVLLWLEHHWRRCWADFQLDRNYGLCRWSSVTRAQSYPDEPAGKTWSRCTEIFQPRNKRLKHSTMEMYVTKNKNKVSTIFMVESVEYQNLILTFEKAECHHSNTKELMYFSCQPHFINSYALI